jgi:2-dehydro-3-deoxyphosphogluconate aldolase/(4S)-4-hydroxy-2-oxoglutarate aldolase
MKDSVAEQLTMTGLIPVAAFDDPQQAVPACRAIAQGGVGVMEITLRTPAGLDAIAAVRAELPEIVVGAGTVLTLDQAKKARDKGAQFIVSPGFSDDVVRWCVDNQVPVYPGCVTPTEIQRGLSMGLHTFKFFPAGAYGGIKTIKALYGPFKSAGVSFIPTGGVDLTNIADYVAEPAIAAIGGGWLCNSKLVRAGDFSALTSIAAQSVQALLGFEFAHLGINPREGVDDARWLCDAFGLPFKAGNSSDFLSPAIEACKTPTPGDCGHIAIRTNNLRRAAWYLERQGLEIDWTSLKEKNGAPIAVYLKKQAGGFGVHLLQK